MLREQLQSGQNLSTPTPERLATWRLFFESSWALLDVLDRELQAECSMPLRWYDVLVHLEEAPGTRLRMGELGNQILSSKSGLTRVVDRLEEAGFVRRERADGDRRVIEVVPTDAGMGALAAARPIHRRGIQEYFARHLDDPDVAALGSALKKVHDEVRAAR